MAGPDNNWFAETGVSLADPNDYPTAIYVSDSGKFYQKGWDLNDYGGGTGVTGGVPIIGDMLDSVGSPTVVTTGYQEIPDSVFWNYIDPKLTEEDYRKSSGIQITPNFDQTMHDYYNLLPDTSVVYNKKTKKTNVNYDPTVRLRALGGHLYKNAGPIWSNNPASMIEHFEGFRESPYRDGTAWSVGYGQYKNGYGANLDWDALLSGKKKLTRSEAHQQVLRTITDLKKKLKNTLGEKLYNSLTPGQLMGYLDTGYQRPASMISAAKVHKNKGAAAAASALGVNGFADRNAARRAAFTGNWDDYTEHNNREYTPNKSTGDNYVRQMLNNYEAPAFQPITLSSANLPNPWMDYLSKISQQSPVSFNTPIGPTRTEPSIITSKPISFNVPSFANNTRPEVMESVTQLPQYQSILNSTLFNDPYLLFKNV
jgi:GH24 family phage-related lysozyme (muramidase)